jgi:hypothetical protein
MHNLAKKTAMIAAKREKKRDSKKNCLTSSTLLDPTTFLIPTSFARFADLAVERFMKLMQAMSKIITATIVKT